MMFKISYLRGVFHMFSVCCPLKSSAAVKNPWTSERLGKLKRHLLTDQSERFGRLLIRWHEVKPEGRKLIHDYAACIDTDEWQLYIDCGPRKIFAKCLVQLCLRPLHALIKTIYHISMVPIFLEIKKNFCKEQGRNEGLKNSVRSIADIVRTPLYNTAIILTTLTVLVIGMLSPQFAYTGRSWIGKIEQMGNWGEKHTLGTLAPCFQPFDLDILDAPKYGKRYSNTIYVSGDELEIRLQNFARGLIHHQRRNCNVFDGCMKLDKNIEYISSVLEIA
jgi:hypothetical protein